MEAVEHLNHVSRFRRCVRALLGLQAAQYVNHMLIRLHLNFCGVLLVPKVFFLGMGRERGIGFPVGEVCYIRKSSWQLEQFKPSGSLQRDQTQNLEFFQVCSSPEVSP